jgi:hypothetical protein
MCRLALLAATLLVAACESPTRPVPQRPTPASPIPAPPAPAAPAPAGLVDLRGEYTLTCEVGSGCAEVPKELRTTTDEASIRYHQSFGSSDLFHAYLSGAKFHEDQLPVWIEVAGNSVGIDLSDNAILEQPSPRAYLATAG